MLKDEAIQFYTQLVEDQVPWRRSADGDRQLSDTESSAKPISWSEMKTAFEASYLSADALARSVEQIVTLTQGPNESVTSYANRLRDSFNNLNRQVQKHVQPVEALQIGIVERGLRPEILELFFFFSFFFFSHFHFSAAEQAVVTGVVPSPPRFLPSIFIAHRIQQFHCSSIFHRVLLTHALALSASQFVHKKKSQRIYTSMHSAGLELTKLTYTGLEDNLIRHRGDRLTILHRV